MRILFKPHCYCQQRQREKPVNIYPVLLAMYATYLHQQKHTILWDIPVSESYDKIIENESQIDIPFFDLPFPNRVLTKALSAKYQQNGNYKYLPGTHIQSALDCWWHKCTFCHWAERYKDYQTRDISHVLEEINDCVRLGFKEIFDDSGTFPIDNWLYKFCDTIITNGLNKKIKLSCNMRAGILSSGMYKIMKLAGFRMLLFGLESANQKTLDRINKGIEIEIAKESILSARKAGLEPHITAMIGYPWETMEDTFRTINMVKQLLIKGIASTAQMSFYDPPAEQERGNENYREYVRNFYEVGFNPFFWGKRVMMIRSLADIKYLIKGVIKGIHYE